VAVVVVVVVVLVMSDWDTRSRRKVLTGGRQFRQFGQSWDRKSKTRDER